MTTYYVSFAHGLDANNGLGPDASHATNKPWKTLGKALGAAGIASGDTVHVAPGTQREVVAVAMTSATVETKIIGDVENAQGFKDGSGVLLAGGPVVWTAYTTNDVTTPPTSAVLDPNGRDFLTFENLRLIGGNTSAGVVNGNTVHSTNITLRNLAITSSHITAPAVSYVGLADVPSRWLIERCMLQAGRGGVGVRVTLPTSAVADYDADVQINNCVILIADAGVGVQIGASGALAFKGGGVHARHCTIFGATIGFQINSANISVSIPCMVKGCLIAFVGTGINATTLGQITEDYNLIRAVTARSNVAVGSSSVADLSHALMLEMDAWPLHGRQPRPFFMPMAGSPQLGFGTPSGSPTVDLANRPRPAGGASLLYAVGALERHDTAAREVTVVDAGGVGIKLVGPADQDLLVAVDAAATVLSVKVRYDSTHGTTNKPQALLLVNGEIGVAAQTLTASVGVDTWETLTFASFTPTAAGWVTVRLRSRPDAGGGIAYFDTADVA